MADGKGGPGIKQLQILVGTWDTTGALTETGRVFSATDRYEWFPGEHFLLHHVDADMDGHAVRALEIFGIDPIDGGIIARSYDNGGGTIESTVARDDRDFLIDAETERFRGHFTADFSKIDGRWEQRHGDEWRPWMTVTLVKQPQ